MPAARQAPTRAAHFDACRPYQAYFDAKKWISTPVADLYRYFDCTEAAEFLYSCVARTVEKDLPREMDYLRRHDEALRRIMETVEMPDRVAENLVMFIRQNNGALPKKRRRREFEALTDKEIAGLEEIVADAFEGFVEAPEE